MLPPPPVQLNESWRLHLGPPPARPFPLVRRAHLPTPVPVAAVVANRHHLGVDWRLRVSAGVALLFAIVALGGVG